jgi:hypothetical protein
LVAAEAKETIIIIAPVGIAKEAAKIEKRNTQNKIY